MASALSKPEYQTLGHVLIDIMELRGPDLNTPEHSNIYRAPCTLRNVKAEAYTPQLVSIGPFHYDQQKFFWDKDQQKLDPMQNYKLRYFRFFCIRVFDGDLMKGYRDFLKTKEAAIRNCYAEELPGITSEMFVDMMLLDSVFIMELFLREESSRSNDSPKHEEDDCLLGQAWLKKGIQRDLLLLENQIPMSVLDHLYETVVPKNDRRHPCFGHLARNYFACLNLYKKEEHSNKYEFDEKQRWNESLHFTDLIRNFYLSGSLHMEDQSEGRLIGVGPTSESLHIEDQSKGRPIRVSAGAPCESHSNQTVPVNSVWCWPASKGNASNVLRPTWCWPKRKPKDMSNVLRTATKLQEAGVSFEKVKDRHLLDIKFEKHQYLSYFLCLGCIPKFNCVKARFEIPQLKVDHMTECVLRNLIAFEQCHYAKEPYVCNYVSLIDSLIHTKDDVELLVEKEVIVHELGSDKEVATLVNGLCRHVVAEKTCYKKDIDELNKHYQNMWYRTMAALRLVYFRDPWRASSTVVGIAVLVFTIFNFCRIVRVVF